MRQPYVLPRRRLFFAVWLTVVALPVLLIDNIPRTEARAAPIEAVSADAIDAASTAAAPSTTASRPANPVDLVPTSAKLRAPVTSRPTTTTTNPTTTAPKHSTPATSPRTAPPATSPPTTAAPANEQTGGASWYDYNPGECAHLSIPKGTVVTVTRLDTGASATCVVTDRGPHGAGRIIDLDRGTFAQLAGLNAGVIEVRITW